MSRRALSLLLLVLALAGLAWFAVGGAQDAGGEPASRDAGASSVEETSAEGAAREDAPAFEDEAAPIQRQELSRSDDPRPRTAAATVLVLDALGRPLPGATVRASAAGAFDEQVTGDDGQAALTLPLAPTVELTARGAGHLPAGLAEHPFGATATIRLAAAAVLLARLRDGEGVPLEGVSVRTRGRTGARGDTDAAGLVVLDALRPGTYDLTFESPRGRASRFFMLAGVYLAPGDNRIDVAMPPGHSVSGVARSMPSGAVLAGVAITLTWEARAGNVAGFHRRLEALTDADGRFAFTGVAPGSVRVRADAEGHTATMHTLELRESRGESVVAFDLVAAVVLRGTVVDVDRTPVADAEVTFGWWGGDQIRFGPTAPTDAQGRFELREVPVRASAFVAASKPGRAPSGIGVDKLQPGEVRDGVVIEMKCGVAVRGRVRSEVGVALADARVQLALRLGAERYATVAITDADGGYAFDDVAAFPSRLTVSLPGYVPFGVDVNLGNDKPIAVLDEVTLRVAHTLEGVVVARGQEVGLAAARVSVVAHEKGGTRIATWTDDLGRFTLADLPRGEYSLDVRGPEVIVGKPVAVQVPHSGRLRVFVDPMVPVGSGILELRVLDAVTGQAKPDVSITGVDKRRMAYVDGTYSLRGLNPGRVDLQLGAEGYQPVAIPAALVAAGQTRRLGDVLLQPAASLRVCVLDERGRPFEPAQVKVELVDRQQLTLATALVPVVDDARRGNYRWAGLALSRFTLRVRGPATHVPQEQAVDLFTAQTTELRVALARVPGTPPAKTAAPRAGSGR